MAQRITLRRTLRQLAAALLLVILGGPATHAAHAQSTSLPDSGPQQTSSASANTPGTPQLRDSATREGPFTLNGQQFMVLFTYKLLSQKPSPRAAAPVSASTLARVQIFDSHGDPAYLHDFPYNVTQGRFSPALSASSLVLSGSTGAALLLRFLEAPDSSPQSVGTVKESWQLFSPVQGHLAPLGGILPLGQGASIAVGGAVAAVMMKGGIAVMPMASTAEVLEFPAWTGNFYAAVPVRFDWAHGQWGEGEQCYKTGDGNLTERGCIMPVRMFAPPRPPDGDPRYVQLFVAPDGNTDGMLNVPVNTGSRIEFLEMQAIVRWHTEGVQGLRVSCSFSGVWLRTRIDGQEGWVHGQDSFDALGLPAANPQ